MMVWVSCKLELAVKFCISQDIINIKHFSLQLQFDPHTKQIAEKCHLFVFTQLLLICWQWVTRVAEWQVRQKFPCWEQQAQQWLPCQKPSRVTQSQGAPLYLWAQFGFFFPCIFCCVEKSTNGCDTCNTSRSIWMSGIHRLSLLLFQPFYLIFLLLAQRWKSQEQILRYAQQPDLFRQ